ncbi:tRNA threonylcarbamoyladenosine biosynthesis protein TsaE [Mycoplasmopsis mustelae]|uniref:tRNA threonylcarbamoyladenosine biosynthesis protein TsaE n=1 Tax=Mycoplasmopsis mustelae TaxID=171289 RepID=A0A4R7UDW9_9BACT|nr:tRNA (adenosine(37)-N6)-threonylcarbamoyltransferase complex ATPase subunit type 1 TsaE [Mycoplasmopsis mustelae]TDV24266.1 tRNA threonylcarbamoyladenosine biosynthesis protein TsaE [Mycoplasmopsis mustelae]
MKFSFFAKNTEELRKNLKNYLALIKQKQFLLLSGEIGSGKTTFVKILGSLLNVHENITSPSFNYMKIYPNLVHIDLYTFQGDIDEFEDYFENNIVAIEWPEKKELSFIHYIKVNITKRNDERKYDFEVV